MGSDISSELNGPKTFSYENHQFLSSLQEQLKSRQFKDATIDLSNRYLSDSHVAASVPELPRGAERCSLLDLSFNNFSHITVKALAMAAPACKALRRLSLAGNTAIGDDGGQMIGELIAANSNIEELSLFHCGLTDRHLHIIVNALLENDHIAVLRLDFNFLTNASLKMLLRCVTQNDVLGDITLHGNDDLSVELVKELVDRTREARERFCSRKEQELVAKRGEAHHRSLQSIIAAQQSEKDDKTELNATNDAEERAAAAAVEETALREKQLDQFASLTEKKNTQKLSREERQKEEVERAMENAYRWRDKITLNGGLQKEWRDGFTVMKTRIGDPLGALPTVVPDPPRRLRACWCDPHDVSAPYAKTLHYHCKYEAQSKVVEEGETNKYTGCRATGHVCASVGFYAKPLPDLSAAHFFASAHPGSAAI